MTRFLRTLPFLLAAMFLPFVPVFAQQEIGVSNQTTANADTVQLSIPIGGVRSVPGLPEYIGLLYRYALGIVTTIAIIMVIFGGFRYLLGATAGNASAGKKTIQDALAGMSILFLAYVILYTVNPKTVRLSLPDIRRIQTVAVVAEPPPPTTNVCISPARDARFRRPPLTTARRAAGEPCSYDQECTGGYCFMENQTMGKCSGLQLGDRCKCTGQCCGQMTNPSEAELYLSDTNNHGSGQALCNDGLSCTQQNNQWICARLTIGQQSGQIRGGTPVRPPLARSACRVDRDCTSLGNAAACMYNSRLSDSLTGRTECSAGREGDQCRCSGNGCDLTAPPTLRSTNGTQPPLGNNHGTKEIACQTGLECVGFLRPDGALSDPRDIEYFCQRPVAAAAALAGRCDFSCVNAPTTRVVEGACDPAGNPAAVARACGAVCATQCGARGSTCLNWRPATRTEPAAYNISCHAGT